MRSRFALGAGLALLVGCKATKEQQLEDVAKDWALTIRASQVMPVYPLTEDLQPGDVFLVQLPIDRQQEQWKRKGFLPLDNHVGRLHPAHYLDFYDHSFLERPAAATDSLPGVRLPADWRRAAAASAADPKPVAWQLAPHAGFPSYSFSVRKSAGLSLAIPIGSVPIGLGVLGSDAVDGSVSIGKACTLGIDQVSLFEDLKEWAREPRRAEFLAQYEPSGSRTNYLRIVNRVYLAGEIDVSLRDASSQGAGLDAGAPKSIAASLSKAPADDKSTSETAVKNYKEALDALNGTLDPKNRVETLADGTKQFLPGGSVRFTSASARSVSMKETFVPPLVIGYLGFDCAIGPGGLLGPPVPTLAVVDPELGGEEALAVNPVSSAWVDAFFDSAVAMLRTRGEDEQATASLAKLDALGRHVPPEDSGFDSIPGVAGSMACDVKEGLWVRGSDAEGYDRFKRWQAHLTTSIGTLDRALVKTGAGSKGLAFTECVKGRNEPVARGPDDARRAELEAERTRKREALEDPGIAAEHRRARRSVFACVSQLMYAPKAKPQVKTKDR